MLDGVGSFEGEEDGFAEVVGVVALGVVVPWGCMGVAGVEQVAVVPAGPAEFALDIGQGAVIS